MAETPTPYASRIFLVQTDTTVGFLSQSAERLERVKSRLPGKSFLKVFAGLKPCRDSGRVPVRYKRLVRRAARSTFVVNAEAFRIVAAGEHRDFLRPFGWMYSTSANRSGHAFERDYCEACADVIVEDRRGLHEREASRIWRLGNAARRRLR